jgi:hypothetical protein
MYCNRIFAFRSLKCVVRLQTLLDCDSHLAFLPLACFKCGSVRPKNLFPDQNTGARRPQKHSQIKSPYESKPSLHPTEPQYCRSILLILLSSPFRNSILYPITCPPCSNNKIYCDSARKSLARFVSCCGVLPTSRDFRR